VGLVPVAVSDFYVVGTAVWRFFDVQVGDVQDDFFAVSGCDAPLALFALFGTVCGWRKMGKKRLRSSLGRFDHILKEKEEKGDENGGLCRQTK
jgi:hypothetical protein